MQPQLLVLAQCLRQAHGVKGRQLSHGKAQPLSLPIKLCQDGWTQRSISGRCKSMVNQLTSPYHGTCVFRGQSSSCQGMVVLGNRSLTTPCSRLVSLPTQRLAQGRELQRVLVHTGRVVLFWSWGRIWFLPSLAIPCTCSVCTRLCGRFPLGYLVYIHGRVLGGWTSSGTIFAP